MTTPQAAAALLESAEKTAFLTCDLREALERHGGDVARAERDGHLLRQWDSAEPEARAGLLLSFAWHSRTHQLPPSEDWGSEYANELHGYAAAFEGASESFHGSGFPAMPLPGKARALASSLAFDRDEPELSLKTALLLMAPVYRDPAA
ncbi:hypothetical protein ABT391_36800 [Streptomyces jumonjinensis]|uniref:hypothetical protein n=1 Tax=Streptomyces jumonjinensis TaxID=1945 RepID=UPI00331A1BBD